MTRAVVITSGGLDSLLTIKLMQKSGLPFKAVHFDIGLTYDPLGSHPSLSHTGPIIGAAYKLVGLQMGRACRTYMVSAAGTKTCESDHRNMWSSGCGQDNIFSMFLKHK